MCTGPEQSKSDSSARQEAADVNKMQGLNNLAGETEEFVYSLLELASNDDLEGLKRSLESNMSAVDSAGLWYVRNRGSNKIMKEERTPLMVAASYGSVHVLMFLVALPEVDLNRSCGQDKWTALHCAASGGSVYVFDVVKILLSAGSDPSICDVSGRRPVDVISVPSKLPGARKSLEDLLRNFSVGSVDDSEACISVSSNGASSQALSSSPGTRSPSSPPDIVSSSSVPKSDFASVHSLSEKKQYPTDPSFPDIRDSVFSSDEFRMFSLKVWPCSRAYSHDWTECPFAHPGENARRRDPRKYHYSCVPCPDFRKGACRFGDMCEYAHGVFESWLHPAQYRTRLCKDGKSCTRQVCFFAHTQEELRPLYVATGSGVPSPRTGASAPGYMDMATALNLLPGSPTSKSVMSPVSNPAMSPKAIGMPHPAVAWPPQANVPTLHLPGGNLQSSRLRSSLNARDIPPENLHVFPGNGANSASSFGQSMTTLTPSCLDELFSGEMTSSPRFSDREAVFGVLSPTHKSAVLSQFHPQQSMLSPIKTRNAYAPRNVERSLLQASFGASSPRMSPRSAEPTSPMAARLADFAQRERQQQVLRSLSSRDLGINRPTIIGSPTTAWSSFGHQNGELDWRSGSDHHFHKSLSYEVKTDLEEPDISWVQSLVKESPHEMMDRTAARTPGAAPSGECSKPTYLLDSVDHSVLEAWLEQMQLDHLTT